MREVSKISDSDLEDIMHYNAYTLYVQYVYINTHTIYIHKHIIYTIICC